MPELTLVYAYYDNPEMLAEQYIRWFEYPNELKRRVSLIVVDDASPKFPAVRVARPHNLPRLSIYRVAVDVPWHQDGARNLAAHVAQDDWMFMSDMDHALPADSLRVLLRATATHDGDTTFFTFPRLEAPDMKVVKKGPGANIFAITRRTYWEKMRGYDEDMCGQYGSDGEPRRRLLKHARNVVLADCHVVRYGSNVIADANTTAWERKGPENEVRKRRAIQRKHDLGRDGRITHLDFEWSRVL